MLQPFMRHSGATKLNQGQQVHHSGGSAFVSVKAADDLKETKINEWLNTREEPDLVITWDFVSVGISDT